MFEICIRRSDQLLTRIFGSYGLIDGAEDVHASKIAESR